MAKTAGQQAAADLFKDLRADLRGVRSTVRHITLLGELMADRTQDLDSRLNNMQQTVDRVQARVADHETAAAANAEALKTELENVKGQLAQSIGPQAADAAFEKLDAIQADLESTGQGTPTTGGEPVVSEPPTSGGADTGSTQPAGTSGEAVIPGAPGSASGPATNSPTGTIPPADLR